MYLLIAFVLPSLCLLESTSALGSSHSNPTTSVTVPSAIALGLGPVALSKHQMTSLSKANGQPLTLPSAAASESANLTAVLLSQAAAAASSQALAGASGSTDAGSQVVVLAQIIIAIGVIPVELIIMAIVLGVHRLTRGKPSRPLQTRSHSAGPRRNSLPYLQPKAELEDEQRRRHELPGEHVVHELDCEDEIYQIADDEDELVLPLQGTNGIHEMPEGCHMRWGLPLQGRVEVMGDEHVQELDGQLQGSREDIGVEDIQELKPPVHAKEESMLAKNGPDFGIPGAEAVMDSANVNPSRSHFMLRQQ